MRKLYPRLNLLHSLPELADFLQQAAEFHVTDYLKFRGSDFQDKLCQGMIDISQRCLSAEFDLLKPKLVLLTCMAGKDVLEFLSHHLQRHLQRSKFVVVPHWSRRFDEHEWVSRVRDAIRKT